MAPGMLEDGVDAQRHLARTLTSLKRWSVGSRELPSVSQIKAIHVYDFDNTLFLSPLPNPQLWNGPTLGFLQAYESFANGGWWHDPNLLAATGEGVDKEEPRGWNGWWNDHIVRLVELSMRQKDALTVLLTGRSEASFAGLVKRIVASKNLMFDLVCLKPDVGPNRERFASTIDFKQALLEDLVLTYKQTDEIRVYEDRVKHVKRFREFFEAMNRKFQSAQGSTLRKPITAEVIQVAEGCTYLDPVTETAEVQRMINAHNLSLRSPGLNATRSPFGRLRIKRTVFYTGYLISSADSTRLISQLLSPILPAGLAESNDLKYMANSIIITPRPVPQSILDKVGGLGKKCSWQVTGTGSYEGRVWAARVAPVPSTEKYYTENPLPFIVLAVRKGARPIDAGKIQNWHPTPPEKTLTFDTVVGEKVVLRVEEDNPNEGEWESQFLNKNNKRRIQQERDEDILYPHQLQNNHHSQASHYRQHNHHHYYGAADSSAPSHSKPSHHSYYSRRGNGATTSTSNYYDDAPRRGGSLRGRARGSSGMRGGGRASFRGAGRGGRSRARDAAYFQASSQSQPSSSSAHRSYDEYAGYEAGAEDRRGAGGGSGPAMNY